MIADVSAAQFLFLDGQQHVREVGREKKREVAQQRRAARKEKEEIVRHGDGGCRSTRWEPPREQSDQSAWGGPLQELHPEVQELLCRGKVGDVHGARRGHEHGEVLQHHVPDWEAAHVWGIHPCGLDAYGSKLFTSGVAEVAEGLESSSWMEEALPSSHAAASEHADLGSHGVEDGRASRTTDGSVPAYVPVELLSTRGIDELASLRSHPSRERDDEGVESVAVPRRRVAGIENGAVQRQHLARLGLPLFLDEGLHQDASASKRVLRLEFHLPRVPPGVEEVHGGAGAPEAGLGTVPASSQRPVDRPRSRNTVARGGSEEGKMGRSEVHESIRTTRPTWSGLSDADGKSKVDLRDRRKVARCHLQRPPPRGKVARSRMACQGEFVADLFSGSGAVSAACHRLGLAARQWEVEKGAEYDLTAPFVKRQLRKQVSDGRVIVGVLAPPCASFSTLQNLRGPVRSPAQPWGLANLDSKKQQRIEQGNKAARAALYYLGVFLRGGVPAVLEHPASSMLWQTPEVSQLLQDHRVCSVVLDQCQYGGPFRKRTRLMFIHCDRLDVEGLGKLCGGSRVCNITGRPHKPTIGSAPSGGNWSARAAAYPPRLADGLLYTLLGSRFALLANRELRFGSEDLGG